MSAHSRTSTCSTTIARSCHVIFSASATFMVCMVLKILALLKTRRRPFSKTIEQSMYVAAVAVCVRSQRLNVSVLRGRRFTHSAFSGTRRPVRTESNRLGVFLAPFVLHDDDLQHASLRCSVKCLVRSRFFGTLLSRLIISKS